MNPKSKSRVHLEKKIFEWFVGTARYIFKLEQILGIFQNVDTDHSPPTFECGEKKQITFWFDNALAQHCGVFHYRHIFYNISATLKYQPYQKAPTPCRGSTSPRFRLLHFDLQEKIMPAKTTYLLTGIKAAT